MPRRVAVIDVSHWHSTDDASYLRILRDLGRDIVGVSDRNEAISRGCAARFESTPITDYRRIMEETKPEFVIALGRHRDMPDTCRYLVDAGVPFAMEKPWDVDPDSVDPRARHTEAKGACGRPVLFALLVLGGHGEAHDRAGQVRQRFPHRLPPSNGTRRGWTRSASAMGLRGNSYYWSHVMRGTGPPMSSLVARYSTYRA